MDVQNLILFITGQTAPDVFFKLFSIVFALLYIAFSLVIQRQVMVMNKTLETGADYILSAISGLQTVFAILILLLSIIML